MALSDITRLWDGTEESWLASTKQFSSTYISSWATRQAAKNLLIGAAWSDVETAVTGGSSDTTTDVICISVDIAPIGDPLTSDGGPSQAQLDCKFISKVLAAQTVAVAESDSGANAFDTWRETWEGGGESVTIGEGFVWSDAGIGGSTAIKDKDVSAVKLFPTATITLTGRTNSVTSDAKTYLLGTFGKVNTDAVTIKSRSYAANSLLFLGSGLTEVATSTYDVTLKFGYRHEASWNHFWRKDKLGGPGWSVMVDAGGDPPYSDAAFSDLEPKNW